MKFNEFVKEVTKTASENGITLSQKDTKVLIESVFETVFQATKDAEDSVKVPNFGKFSATVKHNVSFRNPRDGTTTIKPIHYKFRFEPFQSLKDRFYGTEPESTIER
jgi:nucleoid DNA-binding protein